MSAGHCWFLMLCCQSCLCALMCKIWLFLQLYAQALQSHFYSFAHAWWLKNHGLEFWLQNGERWRVSFLSPYPPVRRLWVYSYIVFHLIATCVWDSRGNYSRGTETENHNAWSHLKLAQPWHVTTAGNRSCTADIPLCHTFLPLELNTFSYSLSSICLSRYLRGFWHLCEALVAIAVESFGSAKAPMTPCAYHHIFGGAVCSVRGCWYLRGTEFKCRQNFRVAGMVASDKWNLSEPLVILTEPFLLTVSWHGYPVDA